MVTTTLGMVLLLSQTLLGGHGLVATAESCTSCGLPSSAVSAPIVQLQTSPSWCERKAAARALRRFGWECHPEAAAALCQAMLADPNRWVRNEAAESLAKLAPCVPGVHEALAQASTSHNLLTRLWARKGLRTLGRKCVGACTVCGPVVGAPSTIIVESPFPSVIGPTPMVVAPAPSIIVESPALAEPTNPPPPGPATAPVPAPGRTPPLEPSLDPRVLAPEPPPVTRSKPVPDLQPLPDPADEIPPTANPGPPADEVGLKSSRLRPVVAPRPTPRPNFARGLLRPFTVR